MKATRPRDLLALVSLLFAFSSCKSLDPSTLKYKEVQSPGFFDIGIGYGRVNNTRSGPNSDAMGMVASFKAYPFGRWYGEPKAETRQRGVTTRQRLAIAQLLAAEKERLALAKLESLGVTEQEMVKFEMHFATLAKLAKDKRPDKSLNSIDQLRTLRIFTTDGSAERTAFDYLIALDGDRRKAMAAAPDADKRAILRAAIRDVTTMLADKTVRLDGTKLRALYAIAEGAPTTDNDRKQMQAVVDHTDVAPDWHVIEERNSWWNRFSVFYGRSVSDFDSGGLQSEVNAVGIGYDVSPDLSFQVGYGFYEHEGEDSDKSLFFSVSLNLFAFKELGKAIVGAAGDGTNRP